MRVINHCFTAASLGFCLAMLSPMAAAHTGDPPAEEPPPEIEEVVVEGRRENLAGETRSASEGVVGQSELRNRPLLRPGDVME
ncbi:MAG: hypothetical protein HKP16_00760, partial [Xanthomonadales bacterium]|nr:hypothetical protein [Xanthomonadales bacterium]